MRRPRKGRKRTARMMASNSDGSSNESPWKADSKRCSTLRRSTENETNTQPFVRLTRSSTRTPTSYDAEPRSDHKLRAEQSFSSSIDLGSSTFFEHSHDAESLDLRFADLSRPDHHSSPSVSPSHKLCRQRGKLVHFQTPEPITEHSQSTVTGGPSTMQHRSLVSPVFRPTPSVSDSDSERSPLRFSRLLRSRVSAPGFHPSADDHHSRDLRSHPARKRLRGRPRKIPTLTDESVDDPEICRKSLRCSNAREEFDDGTAEHTQEEREAISSDRRYPVRNRRHTAMYQIEYPQHSHSSTRNWLAGTGYENGGRRRRRRLHRNRPSRGLHHYGSSTSSSGDSASDSSISDRDVAAESTTAYRTRFHASWHHRGTVSGAPTAQVDPDEARFARRCTKSLLHSRSELMPINLKRKDLNATLNDRLLSGTSLADIEPMTIDESIGFDQVGGHEKHIMALKECIILPLMYPEVFSMFGIDPPRGVLFSGPPGTGKTLLARALANECTRLISNDENNSNPGVSLRRPIAFFMRKGADCLSKWVGESERQLRLLFDQAYRMRPSIIFFDEIDGLAPVRSSRQDQIHSSIVSTLLSLMDGLDARAEVVIIGATNRPDAIDPALRRPGRFDREFIFSLPCESVRLQILKVHTSKWNPKPDPKLLHQVAKVTGNFSGADLKALVTETCLSCLRRQYPQVYQSRVKLHLEPKYLVVEHEDWLNALQSVRPSNCRSDVDAACTTLTPAACAQAATKRSPLPIMMANLLGTTVDMLVHLFCHALKPSEYPFEELAKLVPTLDVSYAGTFASPKLMIAGDIPDCLMDAVWHRLELLQIFTLSLTNLVAFPLAMGICPEAAITQILSAVKRTTNLATPQPHSGRESAQGVVLYLPFIDVLFSRLSHSTAAYLVDRLEALVREAIVDEIASIPSQSLNFTGDLSHAIATRSHRLLIVATVQRRLTSTGHIVSPRTCNINQLPNCVAREQRPIDEISPLRYSASQSAKPTSPEELCNGITATRKTSPRSKTSRFTANSPSVNASSPTSLSTNNCPIRSNLECNLLSVNSCSSPSGNEKSMGLESSSPGRLITPKNCNTRSTCDSKANKSSSTVTCSNDASPQFIGVHDKARCHRLLSRLFSQCSSVHVHVASASRTVREAFFNSLLDMWLRRVNPQEPIKSNLKADGSAAGRPPTPVPVIPTVENDAPANTVASLSPEELLQIEREEAQLFRRLRQVLRRVVAHLARHRRFAVFTRPVQVDEAPDYYDVIKTPMDLGSIRDRIDARHYTNVEDFMKDVELIYYNALEYNPPNVPRSRDIRSRASEFWDEACLQLEEELHPPDLNERCKAATAAQLARSECVVQVKKLCNCHVPKSPIPSTLEKTVSSEGQPVVKSFPMPQGPRYSRRVQGEPPVLQSRDIELLQNTPSRRTSSSSAALSDPELKRVSEKLGITEQAVDLDVTQSNGSCGSVELNHKLPNRDRSISFNSTSTPNQLIVTQPSNSDVTEAPSSTSSPSIKIISSLDENKLEAFIKMVVDESQDWLLDQLLELYRELSHIILTATPNSDGQMPDILSRMDNAFRVCAMHYKH